MGTPESFGIATATNNPAISPERYELCKTDAEIAMLQQTYNLIAVSSTPTKAAFHPSWPLTLCNIVLAVYSVITASASSADSTLTIFPLLWPVIADIAWITIFAFIEKEKEMGGWISVMDGSLTFILSAWALEGEAYSISVVLFVIFAFQGAGSLAIVIQRWKGDIGSVAYLITDNNGCIPNNGFGYLQQGARSRAFRIIETAEWVYAGPVICGVMIYAIILAAVEGNERESKARRYRILNAVAGLGLLIIWIPIIVYESIIAVKGRPVVISGNCMLVELDPKWGFLNSEIVTWWKVIEGLTGL
jgi:hypothetical protein